SATCASNAAGCCSKSAEHDCAAHVRALRGAARRAPSMSTTTKPGAAFEPATEERVLLERCDRLVASAVRAGADQAEAYGSRAESIAVRFEKGDLKLAQVDDGTSAGV